MALVRIKYRHSPPSQGTVKSLTAKGRFSLHSTKIHHFGLIVQDVEEVVPEVVNTTDDGFKSVDYGKLTAVLIEAVKEQQEQIEVLEGRIADLEAAE